MKDRSVFSKILFVSWLLTGCNHLNTINTADISELSSEINQLATNQRTTITVVDSVSYWTSRNGQWMPHGETRNVTALELNVGPDSTIYVSGNEPSKPPRFNYMIIQQLKRDHPYREHSLQ